MLSNLEKRAPEEKEDDETDQDDKPEVAVKQEALSEKKDPSVADQLSSEKIKKLKQDSGVSILDMLNNSAKKSQNKE